MTIAGCLGDWSWCDVIYADSRGWIYGADIAYPYRNERVVVIENGPRLGLPIVTFALPTYWDAHYRSRPFYRERDVWVSRVHIESGRGGRAPAGRTARAEQPSGGSQATQSIQQSTQVGVTQSPRPQAQSSQPQSQAQTPQPQAQSPQPQGIPQSRSYQQLRTPDRSQSTPRTSSDTSMTRPSDNRPPENRPPDNRPPDGRPASGLTPRGAQPDNAERGTAVGRPDDRGPPQGRAPSDIPRSPPESTPGASTSDRDKDKQ